ncbi:MAG: hypothetical protein ACPGLV_09320, partial [Bacteroidia bacterium]
MKTYLRILKYVKQYPQYIAAYVVSVLLMALFSSVSLALLDPVMNLLFNGDQVEKPAALDISFNIHNIKESAYFFVNDIINAEGKAQALLTFIFIIVGLNILGNIFRYTSNASSAFLRTASVEMIISPRITFAFFFFRLVWLSVRSKAR